MLSILEELFKETKIDLKLEGFFRAFTRNYLLGTMEFGIVDNAYAVVLDINDIIKNLQVENIASTRLSYNCKKSAESMKRFVDLIINCYSRREIFPIL